MSMYRGLIMLNNCLKARTLRNDSFFRRFAIKDTKIDVGKTSNANVPPVITKTTNQTGIEATPASSVIKAKSILPPVALETDESRQTISFDEVPGPKILQNIAKIWGAIPIFGNQVTTSTIQHMLSSNNILGSQLNWGRSAYFFRWLLDEYGPVVRLQAPFGGNIIILSRPEDALSVFATEGRYPIRSSLDCIEKYRLQYRQFKHAGPISMSGEGWEKLRLQITDSLNTSTEYQLKLIESSCNDFIDQINKIKNKQDEMPASFKENISKWALESLCAVMLGPKVIKDQDDTSIILLNAFHGATQAIKRCESGIHLWKFVETPAWKSLVKNCDYIDSALGKYLTKAENSLKIKKQKNAVDKKNMPLVEALMLHKDMLHEDIMTIFLDMMLIGVNAVSHSTAFLLYHLSRNPKIQRILSQEIRAAPENLTVKELGELKYLKACIKESLRLKPPIPVLSRILTKDTTISHYLIPKGTVILMATYLSSIREDHFEDALKFLPERWLTPDNSIDNSLACIPFGHGPKACLAKNLAEMQLSMLMYKILRRFKVQYHYGDINSVNKLLAHPDKPLKFRFVGYA